MLLDEFKSWEHYDDGFALEALAEAATDSEAWSGFWHPDRMFQLVRHRGIHLDEAKLREWACDCADQTLPIFERAFPGDSRPRQVIQAARLFARSQITPEELDAAVALAKEAEREVRDHGVGLNVIYAIWAAVATADESAVPDSHTDVCNQAWSVARDAANAAAWDGQGSVDPQVWATAGYAVRAMQAEWLRRYFPQPFYLVES